MSVSRQAKEKFCRLSTARSVVKRGVYFFSLTAMGEAPDLRLLYFWFVANTGNRF
jgi:hypothetical protein